MASPDTKNPGVCQPCSIDANDRNDPIMGTRDDWKASRHRIFSSRQRYWIGLAVVALVFIAETAWTWRKWSELNGDLGNCYIPWRLMHGAVLYRDVFVFAGGPFSHYFNALLFKIFGLSYLTLALSNLVAVAVMLLVLFTYFEKAADTWTATTVCVGTTVAFVFGCYFYNGFNYVSPYSTEAVHGLFFAILAVALISDWVLKGRPYIAALAGFYSGIVFLTKPDIFIALMACVILSICFFSRERQKIGMAVKSLAGFVFAGIFPPLFFFFYFLRVENWHDSLCSVVFGWVPIFTPAVIRSPFYQWCTGLDRPYFHLRNMLFQFALVAAITAFYAVAFRLVKSESLDWRRIQRRAAPAFAPVLLALIYAWHWCLSGEAISFSFLSMLGCLWILLAIGVFLASVAASRWISHFYRAPWAIVLMLTAPLLTVAYAADWVDCGYSLPLVALVSCALIYWNRHTLAEQGKFMFPFLWTVFGLILLSKLGFFPRIWHYGFVLAMPAFVTGVYCLFWLLPRLLEKKWQVPAFLFRGAVWLVLIIGFASLFGLSGRGYATQHIAVGSGTDEIFASETVEHAKDFNTALTWIESNVPENATIAAVPQGVVVNYLSHRINPTPCVFWDQNVMAIFGTARMTAAFESSPPDYVLIIDRHYGPLDPTCFGSPGYGQDVVQWIKQNYQTEVVIGHEPLEKNGLFGIEILKYSGERSAAAHQLSDLERRHAQLSRSR